MKLDFQSDLAGVELRERIKVICNGNLKLVLTVESRLSDRMPMSESRITYTVAVHVVNLWHPQESSELSKSFPYSKTSIILMGVRVNVAQKIVHMKNASLHQCFQLAPEQRSSILHDVLSSYRMHVEPSSVSRL